MCPSNGDPVKLGKNAAIEHDVILGRVPDRDIVFYPLVIGDDAAVRSGSVIYACTIIGSGLQTGHNAVIREENVIGDDFALWAGSVVDYGCEIGSRVKVHCSCYVAQFTVIEDDVFIGPGTTITNDFHPGCPKSKECMRGPTIKRGAAIGGGSVLLPGITIGEHALVGAGSVVTHDVTPGAVVVGNPARKIRTTVDLECRTGLSDKPYKT